MDNYTQYCRRQDTLGSIEAFDDVDAVFLPMGEEAMTSHNQSMYLPLVPNQQFFHLNTSLYHDDELQYLPNGASSSRLEEQSTPSSVSSGSAMSSLEATTANLEWV